MRRRLLIAFLTAAAAVLGLPAGALAATTTVSLSSGVLTVTDGADSATLVAQPLSSTETKVFSWNGTETLSTSSASCRNVDATTVACKTSAISKIVANMNDGNDYIGTYQLAFPATLNGGTGNDQLVGGTGNDTINGNDGDDFANGLDGNNTINGGNGNDELIAQSGNNTIRGDAGNDYLQGAAGNDTLYGGVGSDEIIGQGGKDRVAYGGSGRTHGVTVTVPDSIPDRQNPAAWNDGGPEDFATTTFGGVTAVRGDLIWNDVENVDGSDYGDTLTGNAQANKLVGAGGADTLQGLAGNDVFDTSDGHAGNDSADGGAGIDSATIDAGDRIVNVETVTT